MNEPTYPSQPWRTAMREAVAIPVPAGLTVSIVEAAEAEQTYLEFVRQSWPIVEPTTPLKVGRHLEAICEHLEAVVRKQLPRLLITIPPGTGKSSCVGVLFPSWLWIGHPSWRSMFASYGMGLSTRDSRKCRSVIESDWYQERWGGRFQLTSDQNIKSWFENDQTGYRIATSVGSGTLGKRATLLVCDDLQNADIMYASAGSRRKAREEFEGWWESVWMRALDPEPLGAMIVVAHRLTDDDGIAYLLGRGGFEHLNLPQEFEPARRCQTSIGWQDWRIEPGELLFPALYPQDRVDHLKMTPRSFAAQHQQCPLPPGGVMFERAWFEIVPAAPAWCRWLRYWDKAGTEGGGKYTSGCLIGRDPATGIYYIKHVRRGQWGSLNRNAVIRQTTALDGPSVAVRVEREPGSGGKESSEITIRELAGYDVAEDLVSGSKEERAVPLAAQAKAGNVKLVQDTPDDPWIEAFLAEIVTHPFGRLTDQGDSCAGAFNTLALTEAPRAPFYFSGLPPAAASPPPLRRVVL